MQPLESLTPLLVNPKFNSQDPKALQSINRVGAATEVGLLLRRTAVSLLPFNLPKGAAQSMKRGDTFSNNINSSSFLNARSFSAR